MMSLLVIFSLYASSMHVGCSSCVCYLVMIKQPTVGFVDDTIQPFLLSFFSFPVTFGIMIHIITFVYLFGLS